MRKKILPLAVLVFGIIIGSVAAAADVPLGAGDVVKISVFGNPDLSLETRLSEAGAVTYPLIGQVTLTGLSIADAERKIAGLLSNGGFIRDPQVNILVTNSLSRQVSVLGQVNKPGRYILDGKRNIMDVIALAGGTAPEGSEIATLIRNVDGKPTRQVIDLYKMSRSGDLTENIELASGDIIVVDKAPRFYVFGEIQRPGVYRLERGMTVLQALSVGGGVTAKGSERGLIIKRGNAEGRVIEIKAENSAQLQPDDILYVRESWF